MLLNSYLFHLKARNLSPRTVKAASEYISLFIRVCDPLTATKRDIEMFCQISLNLADPQRSRPTGAISKGSSNGYPTRVISL